MVIALPLDSGTDWTVTLAIQVRIKPSQQTVVMQILHWGEDWLKLLLLQTDSNESTAKSQNKIQPKDVNRSTSIITPFRLTILTGLLFLIVIAFIPGHYRVTAPASLEGKIQRVIVAPFDGYIANAYARAGETVNQGDLIAELDSRDLLLQQQKYEAEKNEHTRQYRQALAKRDQAQAHIFKSQIKQTDSQIKLLHTKIQLASLLSPLSGMIISGDLSRSLGSTVKTGDLLFEVAPLDEYRLIILIDEKLVVDIKPGLTGVLTLKALHTDELTFVVDKVSPVFEENANSIAYRVEAQLDKKHPSLRPGMQGSAKIDIAQRSYGWIYLHELYYAVRLWLWSWLP